MQALEKRLNKVLEVVKTTQLLAIILKQVVLVFKDVKLIAATTELVLW